MSDRIDVIRLEANATLEADGTIPKVRAHLESAMAKRDVPVLRELLVQSFLAGKTEAARALDIGAKQLEANRVMLVEREERLLARAEALQAHEVGLELQAVLAEVLQGVLLREADRWW